jgi:hypothetical protein
VEPDGLRIKTAVASESIRIPAQRLVGGQGSSDSFRGSRFQYLGRI